MLKLCKHMKLKYLFLSLTFLFFFFQREKKYTDMLQNYDAKKVSLSGTVLSSATFECLVVFIMNSLTERPHVAYTLKMLKRNACGCL